MGISKRASLSYWDNFSALLPHRDIVLRGSGFLIDLARFRNIEIICEIQVGLQWMFLLNIVFNYLCRHSA